MVERKKHIFFYKLSFEFGNLTYVLLGVASKVESQKY